MRRNGAIAATCVLLSVVLGVGVATAATPTAGNGHGNGSGNGTGNGPSGAGNGDTIAGLASGSLTAVQRSRLASMVEEEKLALEVYRALAAKFPSTRVFAQVTSAEVRHLSLVRQLLARYKIPDPSAGKPAGQFTSARVQAIYASSVRSATNATTAYGVGRAIERDDLAELAKAKVGVSAPDVKSVYATLTTGSQRHLKAFGGNA